MFSFYCSFYTNSDQLNYAERFFQQKIVEFFWFFKNIEFRNHTYSNEFLYYSLDEINLQLFRMKISHESLVVGASENFFDAYKALKPVNTHAGLQLTQFWIFEYNSQLCMAGCVKKSDSRLNFVLNVKNIRNWTCQSVSCEEMFVSDFVDE